MNYAIVIRSLKTLSLAAVFIIAALTSANLSSRTILAQEPTGGGSLVNAGSLAEASSIAGFQVAELPSAQPKWGLVPAGVQVELPPTRRDVAGSANVMQTWRVANEPGAFIALFQDPALGDLIGGESFAGLGERSERKVAPPMPGRPSSLVTFFWREGEMGYVLVGTMSGGIDESQILAMAKSVKTVDE